MIEWEHETLFSDGDEFFSAFARAITKAKHSIYVETYIFDLDALGKKIIELLIEAASRGVDVKVLIDGLGSLAWSNHDAESLKKRGIEIKFFHPLLWQRPSFILRIPNLNLMNQRDHRKLYLVDEKIAFVGSMNISARHLKSIVHKKAWRDTSVILTGEPVSALLDSFWIAWSGATGPHEARKRLKRFFSKLKVPILFKHTRHQRRLYLTMLISRINRASNRLWITTPYFVPNKDLMAAITDAGIRGVDVRALFPKTSDFFGVKYAMGAYYTNLLKSKIRIFEYIPSMLHAKILIIDDFVSLGSSNLNHRSFFKDLEVDVVLNRPKSLEILSDQFEHDLQSSDELDFNKWQKRSLYRKLLERLFYQLRGIL